MACTWRHMRNKRERHPMAAKTLKLRELTASPHKTKREEFIHTSLALAGFTFIS